MNELWLLLGMAAATMATRIPVLIALSRRNLPPNVARALRYVPPTVLAAIIVPIAVLREGRLALAADNATLAASLIAVVISWRTKNLLVTILLGMAAFLLWRAFI
ncbi:MAG: AzlD domain-containing protein [Anaerolineales bacterium]|nr:AzlD domain-containing protein [Anaerolineales bacterium]MBX3004738.1 AzlD domain-containing protein [Anaerolineales bacterium]MCW5838433.1 AzlD domain-containing protein [Anaerolineales bacterium]